MQFKLRVLSMKKFYLAFGLMLSLAFAVQAQTTIRESLEWSAAPATVQGPEGEYQQWSFKGGAIGERYPGVPFYSAEIPVSGPGSLRVTVLDARYEDLPWQGAPGQSAIGSDLRFETRVERDRRQFSGIVAFTPIVRDGDRYRTWYNVDNGPLLERDWAALGGLGWIGKNGLLIDATTGSWFTKS